MRPAPAASAPRRCAPPTTRRREKRPPTRGWRRRVSDGLPASSLGSSPGSSPASAPALRPAGFFRQALRIAAKDLAIEWRSREVLATMTFLAVVVVLIFSFAFVVEGARPPAPVTAGILWIALVVSGTIGLSRAFDRERDGEAIRSLLLSPAPR